ncbi:hypothetical protein JOB18_049125 [Solea senegalensis]|uniref:Uncharacterized protein n=1 Tax=Solea senegalensis TaxID=28829 RepID=A0AAV6SPF2_SOLSE|nr:hypothetical protein JOB18_049125 [Solea senegalensis]KAG7518993.1 hypothetical protein JOB18_049125 [Solea senegalensis]
MADVADVADGQSQRAAASAFSRLKPEIYKTNAGKIIVEDEILNFLVVKMRTLSHDEIVLLVTNCFTSEWIEAAKKALFEVCPNTSQRCITYKGQQKDSNNVKLCMRVLNECGEDVPRFVSHFLDDLPPVSFNHIDVSTLLGRMEQLNNEICCMKRTLEIQSNVCESLREVTAAIDGRLIAVEQPLPPATEPVAAERISDATVQREMVTTALTPTVQRETTALTPIVAARSSGQTQSPAWTTVVKKAGRVKPAPGNPAVQHRLHQGKSPARSERKKTGIIGTGMASNIKTITTKMVSVFASKFDPNLDSDTLSIYLKDKLKRKVICRKIETSGSRFSSFCVTAECNNVAEMYDPHLWPAGSFVRRYFEPRQPRGVGFGAAGLEVMLQQVWRLQQKEDCIPVSDCPVLTSASLRSYVHCCLYTHGTAVFWETRFYTDFLVCRMSSREERQAYTKRWKRVKREFAQLEQAEQQQAHLHQEQLQQEQPQPSQLQLARECEEVSELVAMPAGSVCSSEEDNGSVYSATDLDICDVPMDGLVHQTSDSCNDEHNIKGSLKCFLQHWALKHQIPHSAFHDLVVGLKAIGHPGQGTMALKFYISC